MIATYGEALVDLIEQPDGRFGAVLGGSVCNFTLAVARLALPVTYLNPLSCDQFGQRFARHLGRAGVRLGSPRRSTLPTSLAVVTLDEDKTPSYIFHRQGVADRDIVPADACAALPPGLRLFHTGGLALVPEDLGATLAIMQAAAAGGALISVDANMRPMVCSDPLAYCAGVRQALGAAQLIKVSEEDLQHLGYQQADPLDAARALLADSGAALVALTLGAQGAVLLTARSCIELGAPAGLHVLDTVGCGDCFLAGLVASLSEAGALNAAALADAGAATLEPALHHAIASASLNAMREGCNPPTAQEVRQFLQTAVIGCQIL